MARINFAGIIEEHEIKKYQSNDLKCEKIKISNDKENIQVKAIPIAILLVAMCNIILFVKIFKFSLIINPIFILIGVLIGGLLLFIHELLHAIVYPKKAIVTIGFVKPISFVALGPYPMSKIRFIIMCLLPLILGIIPLVLFVLFNDSILCNIMFGMMCIGIISPYPDIYNVLKVINVPMGKKVLFDADNLVYIND
ncbi:MAG: DUF3267 domain-containing protein [Bacilli bacterium]|nr:DUF3267 domain-containing protein [Bacteroidales bacterium]MDD4282881.1 DUF3267 domain-containing protein [Bacilli bacterium]MDD4719036.1 DUF3267 domain-containing protein [Bacilli bacterium]